MSYLNLKRTFKLLKNATPRLICSRVFHEPFWVLFFLTRKCNLNCKYCFVKDNKRKDMSTKEVKQVIDKLYSLGIRVIAFFGGEPTIRKDFCEILKYSVDKGIFTYFTTNGVLLDKEYIKRIGETGVDFIELSVDSVFKFDDSKKDYARSKKVLKLLLEAKDKYNYGIKTHLVLNKKNYEFAVKTIKHISKFKIPLTVGLINRNTYNELPDDESLFFNNRKDKKAVLKTIDDIMLLKKKGYQIIDPLSYFSRMKDYIKGDTRWNCKPGEYGFAVDCDGSIMLCSPLKPHKTNVLDMSRDYFKKRKKETKKVVDWCTTKCYSNCLYTTTYLIEHPIRALLGK